MWDADECAEEADDRADRADFAGRQPCGPRGLRWRTAAGLHGRTAHGRERRRRTGAQVRCGDGRTGGEGPRGRRGATDRDGGLGETTATAA